MATYLTGLACNPRGHVRLEKLYKKILLLLRKIPDNASYRKNTEAIICHRLRTVQDANGGREEIEQNICSGNLEMLIVQAEDEYELIQKMILWNPWEPLQERPPPGQWDWPIAN